MTRGRRSVRNPSSSLVFYAFHRFPLQSSCTERQRERERNLITAVLTSIYQSANVQSSLLPSPLLWRMALHPIWLVFKTKPPHWHTCACPRCQAEVASHTHGHHINGVCVCVCVCLFRWHSSRKEDVFVGVKKWQDASHSSHQLARWQTVSSLLITVSGTYTRIDEAERDNGVSAIDCPNPQAGPYIYFITRQPVRP